MADGLSKDVLMIGDLAAPHHPHAPRPRGRFFRRGARGWYLDTDPAPVVAVQSDPPLTGSWSNVLGRWLYIVGPGETTWTIARAYLGSATRWREIWSLQRAEYRAARDPSALVEGDMLAMPSEAIEKARARDMLNALGMVSRRSMIGDASEAADSGGDSGYDVPTIGPFGPQLPSTRGGASDSGGGGAVKDTQDPNSPSYIKPSTPGPGPGPGPNPPPAMIKGSAWKWVLGGVAVVGAGAGAVYYFTR